jgi:hypothetical protein
MGQRQTSLSIVKVFLPEVDLPSLEVGRSRLFDLAPANMLLPADLHHLESLRGYSFKKKSLLVQSMLHNSDSTALASYKRLEFLGDAILEIIVVTELMAKTSCRILLCISTKQPWSTGIISAFLRWSGRLHRKRMT